MLKRLLLAAALAAGFASPALAQGVPQVIATCGVGVSLPIGPGGRLYQDQTGILCTTAGSGGGGGGGGATGSVTAPGTSGSVAQAVQGITGGVPQNAFSGQYNSTLPTLASGASGYLAVDSNGRLIQSPGASVTVSNFPATQPVSGTVAVTQSTSPWTVSGTVTANVGTTNGLALDSTLSGVATSNSAINTATGTQADAATASGANTTIIGALRAIRDRLLGTLTTTVTNITGTVSLPTGAATSANQTSEITQLTTANQRATYSTDFASFSVAANATVVGTSRSLGASPSPYSWISFNGSATVTGGTFYLQCATASDYSTGIATVATVAVTTASATPGSNTTVPVSMADRVRYPFCRVVYTNGSTAGAISGSTSLTVN